MNSPLYFVLALAGIVGLAFVVSKLTGTKTHYLEDLELGAGEQVLWKTSGADAYVIDNGPQPLVRSFAHLGRHQLILTNQRLLWGQPTLGGAKHIIERAILFSRQAPGAAGLDQLTGGLYPGGFIVYQAAPGELKAIAPGELDWNVTKTQSATNVRSLRLFVPTSDEFLSAISKVPASPQ